MMYDSVYESLDRPSDDIIEDDEKLDKWFEEQREERKKDAKRKQREKSSTSRHPEQFIMVNNEEEADEIYDMNDKLTLAKIQKEIRQISQSEKKYIDEVELRKNDIIKQALMNRDTASARQAGIANRSRRFLG